MGSQIGVVLAAVLLIGVPELFRELAAIPHAGLRRGMVLIMIWRPRGLLAHREPTIRLHPHGGPTRRRALMAAAATRHGGRCSTVEHLTMRFGGLVAVDDVSFDAGPAPDHRHHRPERRRQDDGVQLPHRLLQARPSAGSRCTAAARDFLLERMEGFRIAQTRGVARTFQNIRLFPGMTRAGEPDRRPAQQADAGLRLHVRSACSALPGYRRAEHEAVEHARYWLDRVGLTARADLQRRRACPMAPSGGWRSRAPCAPSPVLLCLDEPAAGLNPRESPSSTSLLLSIRDEHGIGVLLIEHDMSVVMGISDHDRRARLRPQDRRRHARRGARTTPTSSAPISARRRTRSCRPRSPPTLRAKAGPAARRERNRGNADGATDSLGRPHLLRPHRGAARRRHRGRARARSSP